MFLVIVGTVLGIILFTAVVLALFFAPVWLAHKDPQAYAYPSAAQRSFDERVARVDEAVRMQNRNEMVCHGLNVEPFVTEDYRKSYFSHDSDGSGGDIDTAAY
jgi:hypothetical protein